MSKKQEQVELIEGEIGPPELTFIHLDALPHIAVKATPQRVASIRRYGVRSPITVIRRADGTYSVRDGKRRVAALREIFEDGGAIDMMVPAAVYEDRPNLGYLLTAIANQQRSPNPAAEYQAVRGLMKDEQMSETQVAQALDIPVATVRGLLAYGNLTPELLHAFEVGTIVPSVAKEAARLTTDEQQQVEKWLADGVRITAKAVREIRKVKLEQQMGEMDGLFETPPSEERIVQPAWPLDDAFDSWDDVTESVEQVLEGENMLKLTDQEGQVWRVHVTYERLPS